MQLVMKSSSSSSSSSSQSAGSRPHSSSMDEFQRLHPRSLPAPPHPSGPHRKATKKLHHHRHGHHGGRHSPPPHHLDAHRRHHDSFPPHPPPLVSALHCKADKLRLKNPKHCKKVGKIHRKLIKACKRHKGTAHLLNMHNVCPGTPHHPGCCLHNPNPNSSMMVADLLAELEQHPPCHHKVRSGHHGRHGRLHHHGRHYPHVKSLIRCSSAPPISLARHEATDMQAEPAIEAGMLPPVSDSMMLSVEGGPAVI